MKKMSEKFRCYCLTPKDNVKMKLLVKSLMRTLSLVAALAEIAPDSLILRQLIDGCVYGLEKYWSYRYVAVPDRTRIVYQEKNIDSFSEHECFDRFRLRKSDLYRVFPLLKLPAFVKVYADIGVKKKCCLKLSGEEVFCFS